MATSFGEAWREAHPEECAAARERYDALKSEARDEWDHLDAETVE